LVVSVTKTAQVEVRSGGVCRPWVEALHGRSDVLPLGDLPADTLLASGRAATPLHFDISL